MDRAAWLRRKLEFAQRELLGDPVFRGGVAAIQAQRSARSTYRDLWDAEVKVYSQWGEDGILDFLCDALNLARPRVLELGCGDFRECNSRFLAEWRSASVTMVDSRSDLIGSVRELPAYWRTTLDPRQEWITPDTVRVLQDSARQLHGGLDIVSLDIDGNDYWVAERLDLEGLRIVVVEYQPLFGDVAAVSVPPKDDFDRSTAHYSHLYYGASLRAFVDMMSSRGFRFVGTNRACNNAFFISVDDVQDFTLPIPDTDQLASYVRWTVRESRDERGHLATSTRPTPDTSSPECPSWRPPRGRKYWSATVRSPTRSSGAPLTSGLHQRQRQDKFLAPVADGCNPDSRPLLVTQDAVRRARRGSGEGIGRGGVHSLGVGADQPVDLAGELEPRGLAR